MCPFHKKSKRNEDGGPPTAVFSFSLEREREIAQNYARDSKLKAARLELVDRVLEYRRDGVLRPEFVEACRREGELAGLNESFGLRRLAELKRDGHAEAETILKSYLKSPDWRMRFKAFWALGDHAGLSQDEAAAMVREKLADRSAAVRRAAAKLVFWQHRIDLIGDIEAAAQIEEHALTRRELVGFVFYLKENQRTGKQGLYGGDEDTCRRVDEFWNAFETARLGRQH
jgi:hypothetical protein